MEILLAFAGGIPVGILFHWLSGRQSRKQYAAMMSELYWLRERIAKGDFSIVPDHSSDSDVVSVTSQTTELKIQGHPVKIVVGRTGSSSDEAAASFLGGTRPPYER